MARPSGRRTRKVAIAPAAIALLVGLSHGPAPEPSSPVIVARRPAPAITNTPEPTTAIRIPLAAPTHIAIPELGVDAPVEEYTDEQVAAADGWVDPPDRDVVAWWSGAGMPGDPADNTVYLYGHVSQYSAVFNPLVEATPGQTIVVTTAHGTLSYVVTEVLPPVLKSELPDIPEVSTAVPGRLVLIGCHREPDQGREPTTKNTVVIAEQVPSR